MRSNCLWPLGSFSRCQARLYVSQPNIPRAILAAKYAGAPSQFVMLPDGTSPTSGTAARDARALVLIHGSNASLFTWEPWANRLSDMFRVITLDLPGPRIDGPHNR